MNGREDSRKKVKTNASDRFTSYQFVKKIL